MRVTVHRGAIAAMMAPGGEVGQASARAAGRVRDRAKENAPVDLGTLRNSIVSDLVEQRPTSLVWRIGSGVGHALPQEVGTGPIHARRAPLLVFQVGGRWVSAYSTRGVPATRYLTRAIEATSTTDFR